ncbi:histidine kinase [Duganella sp. Leaf126]|uniref:hybrid sensor histidine kinase/response regulator n=1 Tax=Duganella sp. Leaf126 TaxID=1736266 RepID=UPI0006F2B054|nr:hybrid sensor histidine kinase/response regulator [Duganella sp. Leaf126]KQQ36157.1 histidine kinase [Duganella sp. Leaf126]
MYHALTAFAGRALRHLSSLLLLPHAVALLLAALCAGAPAAAQPPEAPRAAGPLPTIGLGGAAIDITAGGRLYLDEGEQAPASASALPAMVAGMRPATKVDLLGGSYWLVAELRNDGALTDWVIDSNDTLIDVVEMYIYRPDGGVQQLKTGYRQPHDYLLHYGKDVQLAAGQRYPVLIRFASPYYARPPIFSALPRSDYQQLVARENVMIIGAIGALLALAVFNFFIYLITRDRSSLYYSLYVLCYALAWGMTFHLTADLFGWHNLHWHYVPFFLLPLISTLFYTNFLRLRETAPRLYQLSRINIVLPLLTVPSCFFALSYAHTIATVVIAVWVSMALATGIVVWRRGYQPARFFVLGFLALLLPSLVILPANVGLIPALVSNAQLFTLLGGTLDGILLAFALADQIRLLRNSLEQRVLERTAELTEAKEHAEVVSRHRIDFLSAMSHDIRTPLAGVIGMIKFAMRDQSVRGRTGEYLRIGLQNSESLLAILNDILDFSKIDAGRLSIETVDFDLIALIDDAIGILQGQADAKSLLLRCELAPELPRFVRGDPTRLRQILLNLLGNAIKFTDRGEVRLHAAVLEPVPGHTSVSFDVIDTGPGIPPETLPRLFQKFEQADHSTTRRYGGTGLGLAICKELVQLMGGAIRAESRVGVGSTFSFTLPLAIGAAPLAGPDTGPQKEYHAYRLRVLCAEDVRTNQIIVSTLLENMGHDIHIVENGLQALHALAESDYDLVLMDGRMPMMDGEQATRVIRAGGNEDYRMRDATIPIIALTANASDHDRARYLAVGMDGFLSKPVDERLLYDQIEKIIALHLARGRTLRAVDPALLPSTRTDDLDAQFGVAPAAPEAGANGSSGARVKPVQIMPLAGLSHAHLQRITRAFLDEAPRRLRTAQAAVRDGNAQAAAAAIHALKGSASYLSCSRLHALCTELEAHANAGRIDHVAGMLAEVEAVLAQACADLQGAQDAGAVAAK